VARQKGQAVVEKKAQQLEQLQVEYVGLDAVHPNDYNPNRQNEHEFKLLCMSMAEDGFTQPIIVAQDYTIVDGEHRWRAAAEIGLTQIPVVVVPMAAAQARIATLRHNRARGSEDIELATAVLRDLERLGELAWAQDSLDLSDVELQRLMDDIPAPEALAKEQFSEAWVPGSAPTGETNTDSRVVNSTPGGIDQARAAERALQDAKTAQEREAAIRDSRVFRLNLVFAGPEGEIVREALGPTPAVTLLEWCRERLGR
jgi:ParB/RepB/Spo0J family partition protein